MHDGCGRASIARGLLLGDPPIAIVGPGGGRGHGSTGCIEGLVDLLRLLDLTGGDWIVLAQFTDQLAIKAISSVGGCSTDACRWTGGLIGGTRLLEQRTSISIILRRLILLPMGGIGEVPPGIIVAGGRGIARHFAGIVDAPTLSCIVLMHLNRSTGLIDGRLGKAHERAIVIAQVVGIVLVAPVHSCHAVATLLCRQWIGQQVAIARGLRNGRTGLCSPLSILGQAGGGATLLREHRMAPSAIIGLVTGIARLAITVERVRVIGTATIDAMAIIMSDIPAKTLRQSLPITNRAQEAVVAGVVLAPEQTATAGAGVPGRATFGRGSGMIEGIDVGVELGRIGKGT